MHRYRKETERLVNTPLTMCNLSSILKTAGALGGEPFGTQRCGFLGGRWGQFLFGSFGEFLRRINSSVVNYYLDWKFHPTFHLLKRKFSFFGMFYLKRVIGVGNV